MITKPRDLKGDKRYKDAPRFPVIYQYEDKFKDSYTKHLNMMVTELTKQMADSIKKIQKASPDELKKAITDGELELQTRDIAGETCYYARVKGQPHWSFMSKEKYESLQPKDI